MTKGNVDKVVVAKASGMSVSSIFSVSVFFLWILFFSSTSAQASRLLLIEEGERPSEVRNRYQIRSLRNDRTNTEILQLQFCRENSRANECDTHGPTLDLPLVRYRARVAAALGLQNFIRTVVNLSLEETQVRNLRNLLTVSRGSQANAAQTQLSSASTRADALITQQNQILSMSTAYQNFRRIEGFFSEHSAQDSNSSPLLSTADAEIFGVVLRPFAPDIRRDICVCLNPVLQGNTAPPSRIQRGDTVLATARTSGVCRSQREMGRTEWFSPAVRGTAQQVKTFEQIQSRECQGYVNAGTSIDLTIPTPELNDVTGTENAEAIQSTLSLEPDGGVGCRAEVSVTDLAGRALLLPQGMALPQVRTEFQRTLRAAIGTECRLCIEQLDRFQQQLYRSNVYQFNSRCFVSGCHTAESSLPITLHQGLWTTALNGLPSRYYQSCEFR